MMFMECQRCIFEYNGVQWYQALHEIVNLRCFIFHIDILLSVLILRPGKIPGFELLFALLSEAKDPKMLQAGRFSDTSP